MGSAFSTATDWFVEVWPRVATVLVVPFLVVLPVAIVGLVIYLLVGRVVGGAGWVGQQGRPLRRAKELARVSAETEAFMEAQNYIWREEDGKLSGYQRLALAMRKMADEGVAARGMVIW